MLTSTKKFDGDGHQSFLNLTVLSTEDQISKAKGITLLWSPPQLNKRTPKSSLKSGLKEILETLHVNSFLVFSIYFNNKVREKLNLRCLEENTEYKYDYASDLNKLIYIQNCVKHLRCSFFTKLKKKEKKKIFNSFMTEVFIIQKLVH